MKALTEKLPALPGWTEVDGAERMLRPGCWAVSAWQNGSTCVVSALEIAEYPDGKGVGPQWHVSVSRAGPVKNGRPHTHDMRRARRAFGMQRAEEDNHHPGIANHLWLPVDPAHRVDCQCKEDEAIVVEADGYTWTNPRDGACRGCEFAGLVGRPCQLHAAEARP